ncbi:MAG TPA: diphthine--ammonia ligase [Puia sp.]|nr:diphthine--ammonia ligase [Puia sp.]
MNQKAYPAVGPTGASPTGASPTGASPTGASPTGASPTGNAPTPSIACSWSGGKDSCYALMKAIARGCAPRALLNMMNENGKISRSHGLPEYLLRRQAEAIGLPLMAIPTSWNDYQASFIGALQDLKSAHGIDSIVFGDIDLQEHRDWEEMVCAKAGLDAILPIWKQDRKTLVLEMLDQPIEAMIVSCNDTMGPDFLGRIIDRSLIAELEAMQVDPCGENGEYHTLVVNCPLFSRRIQVPPFTKTRNDGYNFIQW